MVTPSIPRCRGCGEELVLEMDPASPPDEGASVLLADPPFRYVCRSAACAPAAPAPPAP